MTIKKVLLLTFVLFISNSYAQVKKYHNNGNLKEIGFYNDKGLKTNQWITYYVTGNVYSIEIFNQNKRECLLYYDNGSPRESGTYLDNRKVGEWLKYDINGCLTSIGTLKDNAFEGERRRYQFDKLIAIEHYKNKKKSGKWQWFRKGGKLKQEHNFLEGKPHGEQKQFFSNGNHVFLRYFKNGNPIGLHKTFYESGKIKSVITFKKKSILEKRDYYESGSIEGISTFNANKKYSKGFYKNGTLSFVGKYTKTHAKNFNSGINGKQSGKWKYYYDNGKLHYKGSYKEDKRVGIWTYYYNNGKRKIKGEYVNDKKNGNWKHYNEKGKLKNEHK